MRGDGEGREEADVSEGAWDAHELGAGAIDRSMKNPAP